MIAIILVFAICIGFACAWYGNDSGYHAGRGFYGGKKHDWAQPDQEVDYIVSCSSSDWGKK